jgi:hypothetical protein
MKIRENEVLRVKRKLLHTQEIDERKVNVCPEQYSFVWTTGSTVEATLKETVFKADCQQLLFKSRGTLTLWDHGN